jgi:hypothetical protein
MGGCELTVFLPSVAYLAILSVESAFLSFTESVLYI